MNRKKLKKLKKELTRALILIAMIAGALILIDFVQYPEAYSSTAIYQLKNDIEAGNERAIEFYQKYYLDKGRPLF